MRLFKSKEEKELERTIESRRGKKTIQRYIKKQKDMLPKLWQMGREALRLEDEHQFQQTMVQYLWTEQQVTRWERYLLTFEMVEARRDQAHSTKEFLSALQAMGRSMIANADPKDVAQMQKDLQMGLARAEAMEDRMNIIMEMTDDYVYELEETDEGAMAELRTAMQGESAGEADGLDQRIGERMKQIEAQMRKEGK